MIWSFCANLTRSRLTNGTLAMSTLPFMPGLPSALSRLSARFTVILIWTSSSEFSRSSCSTSPGQFSPDTLLETILIRNRWVNRKDADGNNLFEGGFLGLDNIGIFNRSEPLPTGGSLEQADSTAWMAFYCLNMLNIALELAKHRRTYEDIASKFFEHFIFISDAMTYKNDGTELALWNDEDG